MKVLATYSIKGGVGKTTLSERTLEQLTRFLAGQDGAPMLLPFASMVDRRKRLQRDLVAHLTRDVPGFLQTPIPNASVIERMGTEREPVAGFAPTSAGATAFRELWAEIAERVWTSPVPGNHVLP